MLNFFKNERKTKSSHQVLTKKIFEHPSNAWLLQNKSLLRPIVTLFDQLSLNHKKVITKNNHIIFLQASGQLSCTIQQPPNSSVILIFPELIKMLTSVINSRGLAILAHELGHIYHQHHKRNISTLETQIEADDFAYQIGFGHDLVEVLLNYNDLDVEVVINGDFIDFLAVPYVRFFDDKFWSDDASLEKLKIILAAHREVFMEMKEFVEKSNKKITYVIGNHDAELHMKKVRDHLESFFEKKSNFSIIDFNISEYRPTQKVVIKHGHEFDLPNDISVEENFAKDEDGNEFFIPPWGSYYVARVINRFKVERRHVASVRPIKRFIINGLIYDFYFTCRFILANFVYYFMVRFIYLFKSKKSFKALVDLLKMELYLSDEESSVEKFFANNIDEQVLITGHTHSAELRQVSVDQVYINTGTWTNMHSLDFNHTHLDSTLTYAFIESVSNDGNVTIESNLQAWKGTNEKPFVDFV